MIAETVHLSLQGAADELNRHGLTTTGGKPWHAMQVTRARRISASLPLPPDRPSTGGFFFWVRPHRPGATRMLDADAEGVDWCEVARIVLHIGPDREPDRARQAFESHLVVIP